MLTFKPPLLNSLALRVEVNRDPLGEAGSQFTLACIVTLTNTDLSPPDVTWLGPDGSQLTNSSQVSLYVPVMNSVTTMFMLEFLPLLTSHAGNYHCHVELNNGEKASVYESIPVQSKYGLSGSFTLSVINFYSCLL